MTLEGDELHRRKLEVKESSKGSPWLRELYELFAPVRQDLAAYEEQEMDRAVDEAVREVRHIRHDWGRPRHRSHRPGFDQPEKPVRPAFLSWGRGIQIGLSPAIVKEVVEVIHRPSIVSKSPHFEEMT
ncbi:MAG: hypothetical protein Q7O66_10085 [Dehalococcoidia bacterium]|nr:hypothetical protein [Dehalococcoidia bacterium]